MVDTGVLVRAADEDDDKNGAYGGNGCRRRTEHPCRPGEEEKV